MQKDILFSKRVLDGIQGGLPIAIGYIPIAIAFGFLAKSAGMPVLVTISLSVFVFAGASQFIAVSMAALGSSWGSIVLLVFMLNLRHLLMSMHIASRFVDHRRWIRALVAFGVTDETYAMLMMRSRDLSPPMVLSLQFTAYISWVAGTWVGYTLGDALPERLQSGLGIALYAMFIALLVPSIRGKRSALMVSLLAMLSNTLFSRWIPSGLAIILTAVLIPLLMTWLLPSEMTTSRENDQVENLEIDQP